MPKSKFSVGERVLLSSWNTMWTVKKISFKEGRFYIHAVRNGTEVQMVEERFERIN